MIPLNTKNHSLVWERKDGLHSVASFQGTFDAEGFGFGWFASGYATKQEAIDALPFKGTEIHVFNQHSITEDDRRRINSFVFHSCEGLTPEQVEQGVIYGEPDIEFLTDNEKAVLRSFHDYEYMDDGVNTGGNYDWAVSEGVQGSAGVSARGASGVISSLVKKGYFNAIDNGPGEDNTIGFNRSAVIVNLLLNAKKE